MAKINLTVSVREDHLLNIMEVAQGLRALGMEVQQVMDQVGVITGTGDASQVPNLSKVPGVESVEASHSFQLPPPDARIQ